MQHNTHSWSWAICLSFTTVLSWVIPFECLRGSTAVAAPVPIPIAADDRGDRPPPQMTQWIPRGARQLAESAWHPVMDLLGSERSYDLSTMGELVLDYEIDRDNPLHHGWFIEGTWGLVPIVVQILQWNDFTTEAHMEFNGMGTTPNEDYLIYIEEDVRVAEAAMVVYNLNTGERLGFSAEVMWFEANDDDSDGITSIPLAVPTQVIEDPGDEFFAESKLYDDYSEWCDFALTQEGQVRVEDGWTAACEGGLDLCIRGFCNGQNAKNGDWGYCINERMYDSCGNLRDTGLGLEYQQYRNDIFLCRAAFAACLLGVGGVITTTKIIIALAKKQAKKLAACAALLIPPFVCLAGTVIFTLGSLAICWALYEGCMKNARLNWLRAQNDDLQSEIDRQCQ